MEALLVRVGIDSSEESGGWNAPVDPETGKFAYVPIRETEEMYSGYEKPYEQFKSPCQKLGVERFPKCFGEEYAHLDPDFQWLTYGDIDETDGKNHRGLPLLNLHEDDLLVFFAGLDPGRWLDRNVPLVQAIIGLYVIKESPKRATEIPNIEKYLGKNAHLRRDPKDKDIIVFAKPAPLSGRLEKCIPIGELDNGHYYLKENLFKEWGGFLRSNGLPVSELHLQHTPLFKFKDADKFYKWFKENQKIPLVASNN